MVWLCFFFDAEGEDSHHATKSQGIAARGYLGDDCAAIHIIVLSSPRRARYR